MNNRFLIDLEIKSSIKPSKGKLLISEPFSKDPFFRRSVILLCEHNEHGSFGFVMNKHTEISIKEVISDISTYQTEVGLGGPVQRNDLFYIHTLGDDIPSSQQIGSNLYMGGDFDIVVDLCNNNEITPNEIRFFLGYSGWAPNQLEEEMNEQSWIVSNINDLDMIMTLNNKYLWAECLKHMGNKFSIIANFPEDPSLN